MVGFGPGTFEGSYGPFQYFREMTAHSSLRGGRGDAHSEFFSALAEQGVVGLLLVATLVCQAQGILERLLQNHDLVLYHPAPVVQVHELADSAVNFVCRPWTETSDYWTVYWDITRAVKEAFDEARISIPYPQRDLHVFQEAAPAGE